MVWVIFEEEYYRAGAPKRVSQIWIFLLAPTLFEFLDDVVQVGVFEVGAGDRDQAGRTVLETPRTIPGSHRPGEVHPVVDDPDHELRWAPGDHPVRYVTLQAT